MRTKWLLGMAIIISISLQVEYPTSHATSSIVGSGITTLTSPNLRAEGLFGLSVAASGSIVVVGAQGAAYTFNAKTGSLISTLGSPNTQSGGGFGHSVAASGNIVLVGSPYETINGEIYAGHAYIVPAGLLLGDK